MRFTLGKMSESITDFRAVTFSGAVYEYRDGILHVKSNGSSGSQVFKPAQMLAAKNPRVMPWEQTSDDVVWYPVDRPVVGEHFFAASPGEWRVSTEVVSVEELVDGN